MEGHKHMEPSALVIDPQLDALAEQIKHEHTAAKEAIISSFEHMIRCGELLSQARALVPAGNWNNWAEHEVGLHPKTVRTYIRYFNHRELLIENGIESGAAARRLLARMDLPRVNDSTPLRKQAQELRAAGWPVRDIGLKLGVSDARVSQWCNFDEHKRRDRAKKKEIQEALNLKKQRDRDKKIREKSDPIREAYVLVRKALSIIEHERATGTESRKAARIIDAMYQVEDLLVEW